MTVGTYTEDNGAVRNNIGVVIQGGTSGMSSTEFLADMRSTAAFTIVGSSASSVTILALNAARKGVVIVNTDANTLYLDLSGGTATTSRYATALGAGQEYQVPFGLTGLITGIWAAAGSGSALVTEFS